MSETPHSNPRIENFQRNKEEFERKKAAAERGAFEHSLYGEAGESSFTETDQNPDAAYPELEQNDLKRLQEADEYERHMERMAQPDYRSANWSVEKDSDLNTMPSRAYEAEIEAAYVENEAFDEAKRAHESEINDKFEANAKLRRMKLMAQEIAELRNKSVDSKRRELGVDSINDKEDKLQELLLEYEASDEFDPEIADVIVNMTENNPGPKDRNVGGSKNDKEAPAPEREEDDAEKDRGEKYGSLDGERSANRAVIKDLGSGEENPLPSPPPSSESVGGGLDRPEPVFSPEPTGEVEVAEPSAVEDSTSLIEVEGDLDSPLDLPSLTGEGEPLDPRRTEAIRVSIPEFPAEKKESPDDGDGADKSPETPETPRTTASGRPLPAGVGVRPPLVPGMPPASERAVAAPSVAASEGGGSWLGRIWPLRRRIEPRAPRSEPSSEASETSPPRLNESKKPSDRPD